MSRTCYTIYNNDRLIFDAPSDGREILSDYFNDLYMVFMDKVTAFSINPATTPEEHAKLAGLLKELIRVKELIQNEG